MLKAILWDNDGVLVDTEKLYYEASREVLSTAGIDLTEALFARISLGEGRSVFDIAAERGIGRDEISVMHRERNHLYSEKLKGGCHVKEGIEEALSALHGKVTMGVVTSSLKTHFDIIHSTTGLLPYFDFVLTREDYKNSKPDPEPYLTAIEKNGLKKGETLIIEDSLRGLRAAKAAEMSCFVVPNTYIAREKFQGAERILNCTTELMPTLSELLDLESAAP